MTDTRVPRPKFNQKIVDENGIATREFQRYLYQMWLRTGGGEDPVGDSLLRSNNLSDVDDTVESRENLGFIDPILDKASPGDIGTVAPAAVTATSVSADTLSITGKFFVDADENVVVGDSALFLNSTDGFLYIPTMPGLPARPPTEQTGSVPVVIDSLNKRFNCYIDGAWRHILFVI